MFYFVLKFLNYIFQDSSFFNENLTFQKIQLKKLARKIAEGAESLDSD